MCCGSVDIDKLSLSNTLWLTERHLGSAVLLRPFQSHESHAVHRLRPVPSHRHGWRVAHHPQHDCGRYLLRHVCGSCNCTHSVSGLLQEAVPRKGGCLALHGCFLSQKKNPVYFSLRAEFSGGMWQHAFFTVSKRKCKTSGTSHFDMTNKKSRTSQYFYTGNCTAYEYKGIQGLQISTQKVEI